MLGREPVSKKEKKRQKLDSDRERKIPNVDLWLLHVHLCVQHVHTHVICKHWVKKWELPGFSKTVPCRVNVISLSAGWWERGEKGIH